MKRDFSEHGMHWLTEFLCGLIGGTMGLYSFFGWVIVALGWLTPISALVFCGGFGAVFGGCMAAENIREKRQKH